MALSHGEAVLTATLAVLEAAQIAAQFAPVPGLVPALQAVISIIQTCNNITSNQSEIKLLRERCNFLSKAIADTQWVDSQSLIEITGRLEEVQKLLNKHVACQQRRVWEAFFLQLRISRDIETCHYEIDNCCTEFSIEMSRQLCKWQEENSAAYKMDHQELKRAIERLNDNSTEIKQVVKATKDVTDVLTLLQGFMKSTGITGGLAYRKLQLGIYRADRSNGILPLEMDLTGEVERKGSFAATVSSATFDIWEGIWLGQEKVAMKTLRGVKISPDALERLKEEIRIWRTIANQDCGRHILPLYGYVYAEDRLYMISPWMANGNVMDYIRCYPNYDRVKLIRGIAKGLRFLHGLQPPIAHGDVRGINILINSNGDPLIADFGLAKTVGDITGAPLTQSQGDHNSFRWFAPEMCTSPEVSTCTDVFSFAMTIIEIMTMCKPYSDKLTCEVLYLIQSGDHPSRPQNMDDRLWEICMDCWEEPADRATMASVVERLENPNW